VPTDPGAGPGSRADWTCIVCNRAQPHTFVDAVVQVNIGLMRAQPHTFVDAFVQVNLGLNSYSNHIVFVKMYAAQYSIQRTAMSISSAMRLCIFQSPLLGGNGDD
jgi:hypothetical protein